MQKSNRKVKGGEKIEKLNQKYSKEDSQIISWFLTGLKNEAIRLSKRNNKKNQLEQTILNNPILNEENENKEMLEFFPSDVDIEKEIENSSFLKKAFSLLTFKQQKIIFKNIIEGYTEKEIAEELGMSQPAVHMVKERGLKKLRNYFAPDEYE